ncbi:hypothetical protein NQ317_015625 [Molorchus minor]|uniref:Phospholipase A2-like domain-containing protein n=1 Tax=Molorchus minor TaxID=1323400 RepID=A0ABQ9JT23_9CUCU|nr:hypothetical protein NQ317_015625 [Molorchus minor]
MSTKAEITFYNTLFASCYVIEYYYRVRLNFIGSPYDKSTLRLASKQNTMFLNGRFCELHIPGYQYCGPGTKLRKRLERGDTGINPLDEACKVHDITYSKFEDTATRNIADKELAASASKRVKAPDATVGEKIAAFGVSNIMNLKRKLGMGLKKRKKPTKKGGTLKKSKSRRKRSRVIPAPKMGGFLPFLLPLLGALGAVGGGAATIAKAVNDAKTNRKELEEQKRHNLAMEPTAKGKGLDPYKNGLGLYLNPYKKNYR